MGKFFVIALVTLLSIVGTQAQIPFLGGCPRVTIKSDFVPASYLGLWYEHSKYFAIFQVGGKCTTATYSSINDTTIKVLNKQINFLTNAPTTITGTATLKGPSNIADLLVVFPTPFAIPAPYQVLDTDYSNYAVVHACNDLGIFHFRFLWLLTRERFPSTAVLNNAYGVMDRNNLPKGFLLKTDHNNCPSP